MFVFYQNKSDHPTHASLEFSSQPHAHFNDFKIILQNSTIEKCHATFERNLNVIWS